MIGSQVFATNAREACVECGVIAASDEDDAYCPWCGSRVPEPFELLAWAELRAVEDAVSASPSRRRRVA